jgi:hypothetical protein
MSTFAVLRTTLDHLSARDLCNTGNESFNNSKRVLKGSEEVVFLLNILWRWVAKLVARLLVTAALWGSNPDKIQNVLQKQRNALARQKIQLKKTNISRGN